MTPGFELTTSWYEWPSVTIKPLIEVLDLKIANFKNFLPKKFHLNGLNTKWISAAVWPEVRVKSSPVFPKVAQNVTIAALTYKVKFKNSPNIIS